MIDIRDNPYIHLIGKEGFQNVSAKEVWMTFEAIKPVFKRFSIQIMKADQVQCVKVEGLKPDSLTISKEDYSEKIGIIIVDKKAVLDFFLPDQTCKFYDAKKFIYLFKDFDNDYSVIFEFD